jgi:hypothetical protein
MYKFVPGDSTNMGIVSYDSVEKCMRMLVGLDVPTENDLMMCDFDMNGVVDLKDTIKVMQIVEQNKKCIYINNNTLSLDNDIIKGVLLGVYIRLSRDVQIESMLSSEFWTLIAYGNIIYVEAKNTGYKIQDICKIISTSPVHVIYYDIVFDLNGVMHYLNG